MTTLPALPPMPAGNGLGMPAGSGGSGGTGGTEGSGGDAFAGLLVPAAVVAAEPGAQSTAQPTAQPTLVPAEPSLVPVPAEAVLAPVDGELVDEAPVGTEPSAAQIIAAAQLTPVGPMLANAPRLTPSYAEAAPVMGSPTYAEAAPVASSPTESSDPAPGTALLVGELEAPAVGASATPRPVVASSAPGIDPVATEALQGGGSDDSTDLRGGGPDDSAVSQRGTGTSGQPGTGQPGTGQPGTGDQGTGAPSTAPQGSQGTAPAAGTQPTAAQTNAVAGLQAAGPGATTTATATAPTTADNPVAGQVFPEVTRLVSRGDGTRRITLQLSPEALGDVRVVLTVRNGEVQVRMSGGELAQQALLAGASELHKLLDLAGATSSQIQVGTQSSTTTLDQHARQQDAQGELSDQQDHQNHRTAGTRDGDTSARDGAPRGTHPHPATNPGTRTRIAGVDVTM